MDEKIAEGLRQTEKRNSPVLRLAPAIVLSVFAAISLCIWMFYDPTSGFTADVPGMDRSGTEPVQSKTIPTKIGEYFTAGKGIASAISGSWPSFRGANRDNISIDETDLADEWAPSGPKMLWSTSLGEGHAAASVHNGRVYVLDYDEANEADALRCLSLDDGTEIWRRWYGADIKRNHGMSRTIPAVTDRYVVTIGPNCHVMCVRQDTGELLWGMDLVKDYGSEIPLWYSGQCPLIENGVAIIAPAGKALLMGVECETGRVVWETANPSGWKMSHSSVTPMTFYGKRAYVYCATGGLVGVSADARDAGKILFASGKLDARIIAPSPVQTGPNTLFIAAGYGYGGMSFGIERTGDGFEAKVLAKYKPAAGFTSEVQTPVFFDGRLFGVLPKDGGILREQFACADSNGEILWTSGKSKRFGLGPFLLADGKFYILNDEGTLTMARANAEGFEELGRAKLFDGVDSWGPIALASGRMIVRDSTRLFCFDMR